MGGRAVTSSKTAFKLFAALGSAVILAGCAVYASPGGPPPARDRAVQVPPGHMPPPGACRIWYPDQPPGQQPPPGACSRLKRQVPPGAVLVRG
jgi:hypothetical protein